MVWTVLFARRSDDLDSDLFVARPHGSGVKRLTDNTVRDGDPAWSPDGARIAFVRPVFYGPPGRRLENNELFVMRADGGGIRRLTRYRFEDLAPSWSPDGSRIAFSRRVDRTGLTAIYTIRPEEGRGKTSSAASAVATGSGVDLAGTGSSAARATTASRLATALSTS